MSDTYQYNPQDPSNLGFESNLSGYVGPYVTEMLGKGRAAANQPYQAYQGPLTAGATDLQQQAFTGIAGLGAPDGSDGSMNMGTYTPGSVTDTGFDINKYMNPYLTGAMQPQIDEVNRQAQVSRMANAARLTNAGAYGGSRQAIMDAELDRNALQEVSGITGKGYAAAYDQGIAQFNKEQDAQRLAQSFANDYGFDVFGAQQAAGESERGILGEGIKADYGQFIEERDNPMKQAQYMQSLLQELPLEARQTMYAPPDPTSSGISTAGGLLDILTKIFAK